MLLMKELNGDWTVPSEALPQDDRRVKGLYGVPFVEEHCSEFTFANGKWLKITGYWRNGGGVNVERSAPPLYWSP